MTVSVVVPWRSDGGQRDRLWAWCKWWWQTFYPGWELVECDSDDDVFTRGHALAQGVAEASGEMLVLADADTLVSNIELAVHVAMERGWAIAYPQCMYLAVTPQATETYLSEGPTFPLRMPRVPEIRQAVTSYSGVLAMTRQAWCTVGGVDPRHRGWGSEDLSLYYALDTLVSPCARTDGFALALYHPHIESERFDQPYFKANEALCHRYQAAHGHPTEMYYLIEEAKAWQNSPSSG